MDIIVINYPVYNKDRFNIINTKIILMAGL
jgi:hypothetical protein